MYKYDDTAFCTKLNKGNAKPIRSNIARNDQTNKGITGLSTGTKSLFEKKGQGNNYSAAINVNAGEKYMLVTDNVSATGKGHSLRFSYQTELQLKGTVVNSDSIPVKAEITLIDPNGEEVAKTSSNAKGQYSLDTWVKPNTSYSLIFLNDSSFVSIENLDYKKIKNTSHIDIHTILPRLKGGGKYKMGKINFYPGSTDFLPEAYSSLEALCYLMKKNKKMIIEIQGHINTPYVTKIEKAEFLSTKRAEQVYDYLSEKGIDKKRLTFVGLGSSQMLYPRANTEAQQAANRRVEIEVISIKGE